MSKSPKTLGAQPAEGAQPSAPDDEAALTGEVLINRPGFQVRTFVPGEHELIADLFTAAVHQLASGYYTPEQLSAWAPKSPDYERWRHRCNLHRPFLAVTAEGTIVGFLELDPDGHVGCTYVHPQFAGQGAMSSLLRHAEWLCRSNGVTRMYSEVAASAEHLFKAHGWEPGTQNTLVRGAVTLTNTNMEKRLTTGEEPGATSARPPTETSP